MKLFKKSALGLAACLLLAGCSFTNTGGSGKVGKETTYEEFMAEIAKLPAYGEHPFASASGNVVEVDPNGRLSADETYVWNKESKTWDSNSENHNYNIGAAIASSIQQLGSFFETNHSQGKNEHYYLNPLSYKVIEEFDVLSETYTYIWNEYGLNTYRQYKNITQGKTLITNTINLKYIKDSSVEPDSGEINYTGGTKITRAEMLEINKTLSHTYTDCTMHQKVVENDTVTESDIKYIYNGASWVRVVEGVYEFGPSVNNCTITGFLGEEDEDVNPSVQFDCYKNPLTCVATFRGGVYKLAWNNNGTPMRFDGNMYGADITLTFAYSTKL